ncbi:hypothetical protein HID58_095531 [Brassica napus]|uniref:Uncharacterized protein n=1 Tax=Brassica napus TaxID=3708 RepID=A0ABQ7X3A7_BRANA|nr:hypothetical protein HID58_095531 [Brassica napus]
MASVTCLFNLSAHPILLQGNLISLSLCPTQMLDGSVERRREWNGQVPKSLTCRKPRTQKSKPGNQSDEEDDQEEDDDEDERERGVIPEIVTNRMISRMGSPLVYIFVGLVSSPLLLSESGIENRCGYMGSVYCFLRLLRYGVSWCELRDRVVELGSVERRFLLGWNEARKNWLSFGSPFGTPQARDKTEKQKQALIISYKKILQEYFCRFSI